MADQILMLKNGVSITVGTPEEVFKKNMLTKTYGISFNILKHPDGYPWVMPNLNCL